MQVPVMSSAMQACWMSSVRDIGHTAQIIHMLWHITVLLGNAQGLMKTCSATRNSAKCKGMPAFQAIHSINSSKHHSDGD